jgi:hypothetical protein
MSVWEAIQKLRSDAKLVGDLADGHHLYLDELRSSLPNWGTTLDNLAKSYRKNIPTIGVNLNALGKRIQSLEAKGPGSTSPSTLFFNLGSSLGGGTGGPACVIQSEFDQAKAEIQATFMDVKLAIQTLEQGSPGLGSGSKLQGKVDKALKRLGEIEGKQQANLLP